MRNIFKRIENFHNNNKWFRIVLAIFEYVVMFVIAFLSLIGLIVLIKQPIIYSNEYDLSNNTNQVFQDGNVNTDISWVENEGETPVKLENTNLYFTKVSLSSWNNNTGNTRNFSNVGDMIDSKTSMVGSRTWIFNNSSDTLFYIGNRYNVGGNSVFRPLEGFYTNDDGTDGFDISSLIIRGNGITIITSDNDEYSYTKAELSNKGFFYIGQRPNYSNGYDDGYDDGYDKGWNDGYDEGLIDGYDKGYDEGWNEGYNQGLIDGFSNAINDNLKLHEGNYYDLSSAFLYEVDLNYPHNSDGLPSGSVNVTPLVFNTKEGIKNGLPYAPLSYIQHEKNYFKEINGIYIPQLYIFDRSPLHEYQHSIVGNSSNSHYLGYNSLFFTIHYKNDLRAVETNFYNSSGNMYEAFDNLTLSGVLANADIWTIFQYESTDDFLNGYWESGYDTGFIDGKSIGYENGLNIGKNLGYNNGYNQGLIDNPDNNMLNLIRTVLLGVGSVLGIELLPNITIGAIILVPIVFGLIAFVLGRKKE